MQSGNLIDPLFVSPILQPLPAPVMASSCWRPWPNWREGGGVCGREVERCVSNILERPGCLCCMQTTGIPCNWWVEVPSTKIAHVHCWHSLLDFHY